MIDVIAFTALIAFATAPAGGGAQVNDERAHHRQKDHSDHRMVIDADGMVMNYNENELPRDCAQLGEDVTFDVHVGVRYARRGAAFGFDLNEWQVPPCARVAVTLINDDSVRHQWMVHGLPRYLYPQGMFHLEANGGSRKTGKFIVPSDDRTYLVHCDMAHHMEKGLKGQLKVGSGSGDLPSVPGITGARRPDRYL
ncbi:MAG: copper oxidase [Gammaproteobacteria bacterium]|nr:copper oxidase [Gammaproteobacteria bacterium]